ANTLCNNQIRLMIPRLINSIISQRDSGTWVIRDCRAFISPPPFQPREIIWFKLPVFNRSQHESGRVFHQCETRYLHFSYNLCVGTDTVTISGDDCFLVLVSVSESTY